MRHFYLIGYPFGLSHKAATKFLILSSSGDGPKLRDKVLTSEYGVVSKLLELMQKPGLQVLVLVYTYNETQQMYCLQEIPDFEINCFHHCSHHT